MHRTQYRVKPKKLIVKHFLKYFYCSQRTVTKGCELSKAAIKLRDKTAENHHSHKNFLGNLLSTYCQLKKEAP